MRDVFRRFAQGVSTATGHPTVFVLAVALIVVWIVSGPLFRFSDTWQLVINTSTTIITFLMVFILQNTQNRDNQAVQLKLDELLRAVGKARSRFIDIEDLPDEELERMAKEFASLHERAQGERESRRKKSERSAKKPAAKSAEQPADESGQKSPKKPAQKATRTANGKTTAKKRQAPKTASR